MSPLNVSDQIKKEQKRLRENLESLQYMAMKPVTNMQFHDWCMQFTWKLRDCRNHLLRHFNYEELGGFLHQILDKAPEKQKYVNDLGKQHKEIIALLDKIIDEIKVMDCHDGDKLDVIRQHMAHLISFIKTHEAKENELTQQVYYQDYGGAD